MFRLSKFIVAIFAVGTTSLSSNAADISPFNPSGAVDFNGLYVGATVGASLGSSGSVNTSGYVGGAYAGYTIQQGNILGGIEFDALAASLDGSGLNSSQYRQNFLSSARVRAGYVLSSVAIYGTLGRAFATTQWRDISGIERKSVTGTAYGLGAEWSPIRKLSVRAEILRYDFGTKMYYSLAGNSRVDAATNLLRIGTHYRF